MKTNFVFMFQNFFIFLQQNLNFNLNYYFLIIIILKILLKEKGKEAIQGREEFLNH